LKIFGPSLTNPGLQRPPRHDESSGTDSTERQMECPIVRYHLSPPCGVV
jgi:hypothetical protein